LVDGEKQSLHAIEFDGVRANVGFVRYAENQHYVVVGYDESLTRKTMEQISSQRLPTEASTVEERPLAEIHVSRGAIAGFMQGMPAGEAESYSAATIQRVLGKLNSINAGVWTVSNGNAQVNVTLKLETTDTAAARQIEQLAKAGLGIVRMIFQEESGEAGLPQITSLIDGVKFTTDGSTVTIVAPIRDVATLMAILGEL
jgi:hypothetical protein